MEVERLRFAVERIKGFPVKVLSRAEWSGAIRPGGEPTSLQIPLSPYSGIQSIAPVTIAASTWPAVSAPGYHHVRYDPADAPNVFNTDSYDAIEDLADDPDFQRICEVAGIKPGDVDRTELRQHVFLVGPKRRSDHHSPHVPPDIAGAKRRGAKK